MKIKLTLLSVATALTMASLPAQAQETFKPYVGFDVQRTIFDYKNIDMGGGDYLQADRFIEDSLDGFNIHAGVRLHKNFGVEAGYFRTKNETKDTPAGTEVGSIGGAPAVNLVPIHSKVQVQGITLDTMGYLPLGTEERVELIGTAGLSWSKAKVSADFPGVGTFNDNSSEIGFRLGAGAQFHATEHISVRGLVRYQTADFDNYVDNAWNYSVGLNYNF